MEKEKNLEKSSDTSIVIAFSLPISLAMRLKEYIKYKSKTKNRSVVIRTILASFLDSDEGMVVKGEE